MTKSRPFSCAGDDSYQQPVPRPEVSNRRNIQCCQFGQTTGRLLVVTQSKPGHDAACFASAAASVGQYIESETAFLALSEPHVHFDRIYWDALYGEKVGIAWVGGTATVELVPKKRKETLK